MKFYIDGTGFDSVPEAVTALLSLLVSTVVTTIVLGYAIYHHFISKSVKTPKKRVTYTLLGSLTFNVLFCIETLYITRQNVLTSKGFSCLVSGTNVPLIMLARLFLYYFFLARFSGVFKDSDMDLSRNKYLCIIVSMTGTVIISAGIFVHFTSDCDRSKYFLAGIFAVAQDIFWQFFTFYLFYTRLREMAGYINEHNKLAIDPNNKSKDYKKELKLRNRKYKQYYAMFKFSLKLAVLTIVASLTTLISTILLLFVHITICASIDVTVNSICVILSFSFTKQYYRIVCYLCRHCCELPMLHLKVENPETINRMFRAQTNLNITTTSNTGQFPNSGEFSYNDSTTSHSSHHTSTPRNTNILGTAAPNTNNLDLSHYSIQTHSKHSRHDSAHSANSQHSTHSTGAAGAVSGQTDHLGTRVHFNLGNNNSNNTNNQAGGTEIIRPLPSYTEDSRESSHGSHHSHRSGHSSRHGSVRMSPRASPKNSAHNSPVLGAVNVAIDRNISNVSNASNLNDALVLPVPHDHVPSKVEQGQIPQMNMPSMGVRRSTTSSVSFPVKQKSDTSGHGGSSANNYHYMHHGGNNSHLSGMKSVTVFDSNRNASVHDLVESVQMKSVSTVGGASSTMGASSVGATSVGLTSQAGPSVPISIVGMNSDGAKSISISGVSEDENANNGKKGHAKRNSTLARMQSEDFD